jgi:hypothetical protein
LLPGSALVTRGRRTSYTQGNVLIYGCAGRPLPTGIIDVRGIPA